MVRPTMVLMKRVEAAVPSGWVSTDGVLMEQHRRCAGVDTTADAKVGF